MQHITISKLKQILCTSDLKKVSYAFLSSRFDCCRHYFLVLHILQFFISNVYKTPKNKKQNTRHQSCFPLLACAALPV